MAIFVAAKVDEPISAWMDFLFDNELVISDDVWHEYSLLILSKFPTISVAEQNDWLNLLNTCASNDSLSDENAVRLRDRLTLTDKFLPLEFKVQLTKLEEKFGKSVHPDFRRYSSEIRFSSTTSNDTKNFLTQDQFLKLIASNDLHKLMQDKTVSEWLQGKVPTWIASHPKKYSTMIKKYGENFPDPLWDPILSGFRVAIGSGEEFDLTAVIYLCSKVTTNHVSERNASNFVYDALSRRGDDLIPERDKDLLWNTIEYLCKESTEPGPSTESDPRTNLSMSINSSRGQALHSAFRYVFWLKSKTNFDAEDSEKFFSVIESRLDIAQENSCVIRSVCGEWLPWLVELNAQWTADNSDSIFRKGRLR